MSEKPYKKYYKDLYDIQDAVFEILESYDFYLTGGTALSRFYLNHRYSDDLDFFVHQKDDFLFQQIRWIDHITHEDFEKDRQIMLRDLVGKSHNSLSRTGDGE